MTVGASVRERLEKPRVVAALGEDVSPGAHERAVADHFAAEKQQSRAWRRILEQTTGALLRQSGEA